MRQTTSPGEELLREVRAAFVTKGTTFSTWCAKNKINRSAARQALIGSWNGPKGRALRQRVITASKAPASKASSSRSAAA